jgi:hypothetical protein
MGVLDHQHRQPCERVTEGGLGRHDGDHRLKTGLQETARSFPHKELASVRFEQLLTAKTSR